MRHRDIETRKECFKKQCGCSITRGGVVHPKGAGTPRDVCQVDVGLSEKCAKYTEARNKLIPEAAKMASYTDSQNKTCIDIAWYYYYMDDLALKAGLTKLVPTKPARVLGVH
jgi:hypothetical protein